QLLARRMERQAELDAGAQLDFLAETAAVRQGDWTVAAIPEDLQDRRVEITGPVDRKMVINALNSGANVFMADFEDSNSPTWGNVVSGQINMRDAVRRTIEFTNPAGKHYALKDEIATLFVRPRGWHLEEKHVLLDGLPISASLFDFGLYFFHNAKALLERSTGPYFYLPKLESHLEARLWNDVFRTAQAELGVPYGTIRATVLIETLPAAFEMDEILYELRDHSAGLNCGRWDYIFSAIKRLRGDDGYVLPNRGEVTMSRHFMRSYSQLAIKTCHRRGIHAMGGMAAQIPIKNDAKANDEAIDKVRQDKVREATDGHDGTWVAHPGLVQLARDCFDERMPQPNQIDKRLDELSITHADLLQVPAGTITEQGVRHNVDVGIRYMAAWLCGNGCVPLYNLMEDAATAEISRSQLWQWVHREGAKLDDGRPVTEALVRATFAEALSAIADEVGPESFESGRYELATKLIAEIVFDDQFTEFLTTVGYAHLG
ncbi:MAG: malate synthase A, partial [Deltaproteobacteria bacterium]|nr:malate synthase A [Deltaproteobacteria bacterium]